jgi:hypothetical protein
MLWCIGDGIVFKEVEEGVKVGGEDVRYEPTEILGVTDDCLCYSCFEKVSCEEYIDE